MARKSERKRNAIDLAQYKSTARSLINLRQEIKVRIRPYVFEIDSIQDLDFEILKLLRPLNRTVRNTPQSIKRHKEKAIDVLGMLGVKTSVGVISENASYKRIHPSEEFDPEELFRVLIGGFAEPPKAILRKLRPTVESHLREINELVRMYESLPEIKSVDPSRNHRTKTILDFYSRTKMERQTILDYYLEGVFDRAFDKSIAIPEFAGLVFLSLEILKDFPYRFKSPIYRTNFDFRRIDCASHRLRDLRIQELQAHSRLYISDKEKFYKELFKRRSIAQVFHNIEFHLAYVPASEWRKTAIEEMKRLFKAKRWLGFYALALPQVEGLFAEMISSNSPGSTALHRALPDKVSQLRPDYDLSEMYFDYFQYELPNSRNRFSHTGILNNPKTSAFDMLIDLEFVFEVFASLNNPHVKVIQILRRKDQQRFFSYDEVAKFFCLVNYLPQDTRKELNEEITTFCTEFLIGSCSLEDSIDAAAADFPKLFDRANNLLDVSFRERNFDLDDNNFNRNNIKQRLKNEDFVESSLEFFDINEFLLREIFEIHQLFLGVKKYVYQHGIPSQNLEAFNTWERFSPLANKLILWESLLKQSRPVIG